MSDSIHRSACMRPTARSALATVGMMIIAVTMVDYARAEPDPLNWSARIDAERLETGETCEFVVEWRMTDGFAASSAGLPHPLLQIDVPDGVVLVGDVLKGKALRRNEFIQEPYERALDKSPIRVAFQLKQAPPSAVRFGLNFVGFAARNGGEDARFVRRRLELPVRAGARAEAANPSRSNWGVENLLTIGDKADEFALPKADGTTVRLSDHLGKSNVIVTTYRAHW